MTGRRRGFDGGLDRIPLPIPTGSLWLCGMHAIAPDPDRLLAHIGSGSSMVVCLVGSNELVGRYPSYIDWLSEHAVDDARRAIWHPIRDLGAPGFDDMLVVVDQIVAAVEAGRNVVVHCAMGIGRAGTTAVCVLMRLGIPMERALDTVATHRPMAGPEGGTQRAIVAAFTDHLSPPH